MLAGWTVSSSKTALSGSRKIMIGAIYIASKNVDADGFFS